MSPSNNDTGALYGEQRRVETAIRSAPVDATELKEIFAERTLLFAKKKRWSINQLADFSGVSRGFLSDVLRRKKAPTLRTIAVIATALDVEPWELLRP